MSSLSMRSFAMWSCAALFYSYQYILRVMPNVFKADMSATFGLDTGQFGQFAGIYYVGYTLSHIPLGLALDRYGPKYIVPLGGLMCLFGMLPLVWGDSYNMVIWGRFLVGFGSTAAALGMFKVINMAFTGDQVIKMFSFAATIGLMGAVFGGSPLHHMLAYMDWQQVVWVLLIIGVVLCVLMVFVFPAVETEDVHSPWESLKSLLTNKWIWFVALGSGCLIGPLEGYSDAWAMQSLSDIYGVSTSMASHGSSLIFLSLAIGFLCVDPMTKRLGIDVVVAVSGVGMLLAFMILMSGYAPFWMVPVALGAIGFFSAYQIPSICGVVRFVTKDLSSLAFAVANMIMLFFGTFYHNVIGQCMGYFGEASLTVGSTCHYSADVYQKGFMVIPIMLVLGILMFVYLRIACADKQQVEM